MAAKMTKGNFETLAEHLRLGWPVADDPVVTIHYRIAYQHAISAVADACQASSNYTPNGNRAFDRERFLKACEDR